EEVAEGGGEEGRDAVMVGIFETGANGVDRAQLHLVFIVGVEIEFAVAVGDLVERPEVEDEIVGIGRIDADEAYLGRPSGEVEGEATRSATLVEGLGFSVAMGLGIAALEVQLAAVADVPDQVGVDRPGLGK